MKIAILGYGIEGKSAERFFRKLGNPVSKLKIEILDVKLQGKNYLKNLEKFDLIVRSPGVPYLLPEIQKAKKAGVEITSATKLFFENAKGILVGITGTKGKGTTATLLYKILKASHLAAKPPSEKSIHLIGNMGIPMLDELPKLKKNSISVLELSSFQLQDMDISPHIAVVLDISPDHLNHHKSFKEYLDAKAQIVRNSLPKAAVFYFPDNKFSTQIARKSHGEKYAVSADKNNLFLRGGLKIAGYHNIKNASMAAAVARSLGVRDEVIKKVARNFKGLPHRLEFVREVRGVKFYNDSASTNPAATVAALSAFDVQKILIAGGASKGLSYGPIKMAVQKTNTKPVILYGENKKEIGLACGSTAEGQTFEVIYVDDLKSAVKRAFIEAKKGDIVVFSPASASFDMFNGYGERGDAFKKIVKTL